MNQEIVKRWNDWVSPNDTVYILGDVCMGKIDDSLAIASSLNGYKYLVPGNHDRVFTGYASEYRANKNLSLQHWYFKYEQAGLMILPERPIYIASNGMEIQLSHFPYMSEDLRDDRYNKYRPTNDGLWLFHGHVHNSWMKLDRQINVGVDVWQFKPVSESTLLRLTVE
jgi:calcineurin-like phosphoesterase family protein